MTNRRSFLLAILGAPLLPPARVKKVVADLSDGTLTTSWVTPTPYGFNIKHTRTPYGVFAEPCERSEKNPTSGFDTIKWGKGTRGFMHPWSSAK